MILTASEIIKQVLLGAGLDEPSGSIVTSSDKDIKLALQFVAETARELRSKYYFPELKKTHTITTTTATQYPLPKDFFQMISGTQWDQSQGWPVDGPYNDQDWNYLQHGFVVSLSRKRFRIFGANLTTGQIFINPTPTSGEVLSFDYIRSQWFFPQQFAAGESVTSGSTYRSASGNIYLAQTTGTTGSTTPTHTTGEESDGTVSWLYDVDQIYGSGDKFVADTDFPLIDADILIMGATWRLLRRKGYDYQEERGEYQREALNRFIQLEGSPILSASDSNLTRSDLNIPEGDYG